MSAGGVHIELDEAAIRELGFDGEMEDFLHDEVGDPIAKDAASRAPKLTGAGAASIHAQVDHDGETAFVDVSWDQAHGYMRFAEEGTEKEPARPFLRPAGDSAHL